MRSATGGSVVALVDMLRQKNVQKVTLACTHGVFSGPAIELLSSISELVEIVTTNTVPIPQEKRNAKHDDNFR
jgi:ribose-phosphate pyrophosphokinase